MPTTTSMPVEPAGWIDSLTTIPFSVWLVGAIALGVTARWIQLSGRAGPRRGGDDPADKLLGLCGALRRYAEQHAGAMPASLDTLGLNDIRGIHYRPVPRADADPKLLVAHDAQPSLDLIEFPHLRPGRCVLFWSGRVRHVTESAFDRLIEADDVFRERLGL